MNDHLNMAFTSSNEDVDEVNIPDESTAPLCDCIPRRFWVGKCMILHRPDGVTVAIGICCNVSFDVLVGSKGPLGDSHIMVRICSSLSILGERTERLEILNLSMAY